MIKISIIFLTLVYVGLCARDTWRTSDDEDQPGRSVVGRKPSCLMVVGYVRCGDDSDKHDGKTQVVRLVDGLRGSLDEGYTSKHGYFEVFGCTSASGTLRPELHVLHACKTNQPRRRKLAIPETAKNLHNFTNVIDLKAFDPTEEPYVTAPIGFPCDPV